jgi:Uma2 family endonuclease
MLTAQRPITLEQFLRLPERKPSLEFEDGEVKKKVSPKQRHSRLQAQLLRLIDRLGSPALDALPELRVTFAGQSLVPDVAVFLRERLPVDEHGEPEDDVFVAPDLAVEIVSPRQVVTTLVRRCVWYADNGVRVALLVDPADRSIILFRPDAPTRALRGEAVVDLTDLAPELRFTVAELFAALRLR